MPSQEAVNPRQIKPESCREPETSSPFQQRNVNLQPPRKSVVGYNIALFVAVIVILVLFYSCG
jgi:hypothetical protein